MPLPRASSGLLRRRLRSGSGSPLRPVFVPGPMRPGRPAASHVRTKTTVKNDLGGPGGQSPPPRNPGGPPDTVQRNWVPIAGAALFLAVAMAYFSRPTPLSQTARQSSASAAEDTEIGALPHDKTSK